MNIFIRSLAQKLFSCFIIDLRNSSLTETFLHAVAGLGQDSLEKKIFNLSETNPG